MTSPVVVGIDLGGTNLKAAIVNRDGRVLVSRTQRLEAHAPEQVIDAMVSLSDHLLAEADVDRSALRAVGVGSPGPLDLDAGRVIRWANLPGWVDVPLRDALAGRFDRPVVLDNDGNAAAFGEYWAGVGEQVSDLVMLTLGTGVGGGVVLDGRVLHGHFQNAGELGHLIVEPDGLPCTCGQRGCLEQYASAGAVARRVADAVRAGESSELAAAVRGGGAIDATHVVRAARAGDALCTRIWDDACRGLALACINIQHALNPALVVLGGGMSGAGPFLVDRVTRYISQHRWSLHDDLPSVVLGRLGESAGAIGAAGLGWRQVEN